MGLAVRTYFLLRQVLRLGLVESLALIDVQVPVIGVVQAGLALVGFKHAVDLQH